MRARIFRCTLLMGAVLFSPCLTPAARAQTQVLDFTGGFAAPSSGSNTLGWEFRLSDTMVVSDLGVFDEGNNGFTNAHQVGLWTNTGTLLANTTLASGLSGTPVVSGSGFGAFRYNSITPLVLTPGSYVVGAAYLELDSDTVRTSANTLTLAPGFTFSQGRFDINTGFAFPTQTFSSTVGHFGPNLRVTAVPEPGSVALLAGLGFSSLFAIRRLRRRKA